MTDFTQNGSQLDPRYLGKTTYHIHHQAKAEIPVNNRKPRLAKNTVTLQVTVLPKSPKCATSKDSDQPVPPPSMARVLVYPSVDTPKAVKGT